MAVTRTGLRNNKRACNRFVIFIVSDFASDVLLRSPKQTREALLPTEIVSRYFMQLERETRS